MSNQMCETAKALSDADRKKIFDFISKHAVGGEEEKARWVKGWYESCLANDNATRDMLRFATEDDIKAPQPTFIQDAVIYADG